MKRIAAAVLCALAATPALAAQPRLTLHAQGEPLPDFVRDVSRQAKVKIILASSLARERISAHMTQVTLGDVLDVLKNYKAVDAVRTKGGYSLVRRPS